MIYISDGLVGDDGLIEREDIKFSNSDLHFNIEFTDHLGETNKIEFIINMNQYKGVSLDSFNNPRSEIADTIRDVEQRRQSQQSIQRMFGNSKRELVQPKKECPICGE